MEVRVETLVSSVPFWLLFIVNSCFMPLIHYFNPGHETAVLNGSPYYTPPANVVQMQQDLAFLPAWYAAAEDFVWTPQPLPAAFEETLLQRYGTFARAFSEADVLEKGGSLPQATACAWGISPQSTHFYEQLKKESNWERLSVPSYDDAYARLCSRQTAAVCLRSLLSVLPESDRDILPRFRSSLEEVEEIIGGEKGPMVIKAPYSSSGRGLIWVSGALGEMDKEALSGVLKKQGCVAVERALDRKLDFAMEFFSDGKGKVSYEGLSLFNTGKQGTYAGNFLGSQEVIEMRITEYIAPELLEEVRESLVATLQEIGGHLYRGYIGVDMMAYAVPGEDSYRLHPCVEINWRHTMGVVALSLSKRLAEGQTGLFRVGYYPNPGEAYEKHLIMERRIPLLEEDRLVVGYQPLCPVTPESKYWAYLVV